MYKKIKCAFRNASKHAGFITNAQLQGLTKQNCEHTLELMRMLYTEKQTASPGNYVHLYVYACKSLQIRLENCRGAAGGGWEETGFNQKIHLKGLHLSRTGRCSSLCFTQWIESQRQPVLESLNSLSIRLMRSQVLSVCRSIFHIVSRRWQRMNWSENYRLWNKFLCTF